MQYYGYLRRNPDDAPDNNFSGYDFWLTKLDQFTLPGEDVRNETVALNRVKRAEMVKAFLVSSEYRERFGGSSAGNQLPTEQSAAENGELAAAVDRHSARGCYECFQLRGLIRIAENGWLEGTAMPCP